MQKYARKETILIKCFQNVNVASPCWVFRDKQDNKVKRSPQDDNCWLLSGADCPESDASGCVFA